jgi:hypothetical protein
MISVNVIFKNLKLNGIQDKTIFKTYNINDVKNNWFLVDIPNSYEEFCQSL